MGQLVAVAWVFWAPHRAVHLACWGYLALACLAGVFGLLPLEVLVPAVLPTFTTSVVILASVSDGFRGRLEAPESCLPARLLLLPVAPWQLAAPAFLSVALPPLLVWVAGALCVFGLRKAPLFSPGLLLSGLSAWLLVLAWTPFSLSWVRVGWAVVVLLVHMFCLPALMELGVRGWALDALLLAQWPVGFLALCRAVRLSRRGPAGSAGWPEFDWPGRAPAGPFAGPVQALFWLEARTQLRTFLVLGLVCLPGPLLAVHFGERLLLERIHLFEGVGGAALLATWGVGWLAVVPLLLAPCLLVPLGLDLGRLSLARRDLRIGDFLAARPVTPGQFVRAKARLAAVWTGVTYLVLVAFAATWAAARGHLGEMAVRLADWAGGPYAAVAFALLSLATAALLTWAHLLATLWPTLTGRTGWALGSVAAVALLIVGLTLVGQWLSQQEALRDIVVGALPGALAGLVVAKALFAAGVARALLRRGLARPADLARAGLGWACLALLLGLVAAWCLPPPYRPLGLLLPAVALVVPLGSVGLAPLAVAWNRHR